MQYDQLQAGIETDALVAEKVMGWKVKRGEVGNNFVFWGDHFPEATECVQVSDFSAKKLPPFSTEIGAAWEVVEHMRRQRWLAVVKDMPDGFPYLGPDDMDPQPEIYVRSCAEFNWMPRHTVEDTHKYIHNYNFSLAETPALAICKAALKAVSQENLR